MSNPTLAILAGGEGSRMGKPKGALMIGDVPILSFLLDRFKWTGPRLLITAPGREHPPGWDRFDKELIDPVAGLGPLRGILTALEHAQTRIVLFATVDMPAVSAIQLHWLATQLDAHAQSMGLMTERCVSGERQIEPFPCALRPAAAVTIRNRLDRGFRSIHTLKNESGFNVRLAPQDWPDSVWINLNDPGEYADFLNNSARVIHPAGPA